MLSFKRYFVCSNVFRERCEKPESPELERMGTTSTLQMEIWVMETLRRRDEAANQIFYNK